MTIRWRERRWSSDVWPMSQKSVCSKEYTERKWHVVFHILGKYRHRCHYRLLFCYARESCVCLALPIDEHIFRWKCAHIVSQSVFNLWNSICFCVFCCRCFLYSKHKIIVNVILFTDPLLFFSMANALGPKVFGPKPLFKLLHSALPVDIPQFYDKLILIFIQKWSNTTNHTTQINLVKHYLLSASVCLCVSVIFSHFIIVIIIYWTCVVSVILFLWIFFLFGFYLHVYSLQDSKFQNQKAVTKAFFSVLVWLWSCELFFYDFFFGWLNELSFRLLRATFLTWNM